MPKKPSKPRPRPTPKPRPRPAYRVLLVLAALVGLAAPGCGDDQVVDHVATCTVLGGLIAQELHERDCPLEPEFAIDFAAACGSEQPTEDEAVACLFAVYDLDACPETLPSACLLFAPAAAELRIGPRLAATERTEVDIDGNGTPDAWLAASGPACVSWGGACASAPCCSPTSCMTTGVGVSRKRKCCTGTTGSPFYNCI